MKRKGTAKPGARKQGPSKKGTEKRKTGNREQGGGNRTAVADTSRPPARAGGESVGRRAAARVQDLATRQDLQTLIGGRSEGGAEASRGAARARRHAAHVARGESVPARTAHRSSPHRRHRDRHRAYRRDFPRLQRGSSARGMSAVHAENA